MSTVYEQVLQVLIQNQNVSKLITDERLRHHSCHKPSFIAGAKLAECLQRYLKVKSILHSFVTNRHKSLQRSDCNTHNIPSHILHPIHTHTPSELPPQPQSCHHETPINVCPSKLLTNRTYSPPPTTQYTPHSLPTYTATSALPY